MTTHLESQGGEIGAVTEIMEDVTEIDNYNRDNTEGTLN